MSSKKLKALPDTENYEYAAENPVLVLSTGFSVPEHEQEGHFSTRARGN